MIKPRDDPGLGHCGDVGLQEKHSSRRKKRCISSDSISMLLSEFKGRTSILWPICRQANVNNYTLLPPSHPPFAEYEIQFTYFRMIFHYNYRTEAAAKTAGKNGLGQSLKNPCCFSYKRPWDLEVLVDAPCSQTGALRRNPDMKWLWPYGNQNRLHINLF